MATITVSRPDVTAEEVADALRQGLGARYHVRADGDAEPGRVTVTHASLPVFRAGVSMSRQGDQTSLTVSPWGLSLALRIANRYWMTGKVTRALRSAPGLQQPAVPR